MWWNKRKCEWKNWKIIFLWMKDIQKDTGFYISTNCMGSVALVLILLHIQCVCVSHLLISRLCVVDTSSRESVNAVDHLLVFFSLLVLEPGALMFQHADVGKRSAAPVVVPVSLALSLQSPGAACWRHAAARTGAARAPVFKDTDF